MNKLPYGSIGVVSLASGIVILLIVKDFNPIGMILMLGGLVLCVMRLFTFGQHAKRSDYPQVLPEKTEPSEWEQLLKRIVPFAVLIIAVVFISLGIFQKNPFKSVNLPNTVQPTLIKYIKPTATAAAANIPGLKPADIKVNLEDRKFECLPVEQGTSMFIWRCERYDVYYQAYVTFYARTLLTVDFINVSVLQPADTATDDISTPILGFMATMPYDDATPSLARAWVNTHLPSIKSNGDVHEEYFSGVKYQLFGAPSARNLQMGSME